VGVDENSNGYCIYWLDKQTVRIEQNIYFDLTCLPTSPLEGENAGFDKMKVDKVMSSNPATTKLTMPTVETPSTESHNDDNTQSDAPPITQPEPARQICKSSTRVHVILEGCGMTYAWQSDPVLTTGIQQPTVDKDKMPNLVEVEGEDDEDDKDEYLLVAEVSEAEALDPCNLAEAK